MSTIIPVRPSMALLFDRNQYRDDIITCTRAGTATRVNEFGLIETVAANEPRINYDPVTGECLGLLCEDARTNLLLRSEDFANASWNKIGDGAGTETTVISDFGTIFGLSADKVTFNPVGATSGDASRLTQAIPISTPGIYTQSFYIQSLSGTQEIRLNFAGYSQTFSVSTTPIRISFSEYLTTFTWTTGIFQSGTNLRTNGEFLITGAQLEKSSFPTSYIPTTSSTVTRSADNYSIASLGSLIKGGQGSFLAKLMKNAGVAGTAFELRNAGGTNVITGSHDASNNAKLDITYDSSAVAALSAAAGTTGYNAAYNYQNDAMQLCADAGTVQEDTSGTIGTDHSTLYLGRTASGAHLNGHLRQLIYRPFPLTDGQLQLLTRAPQLTV